MSDRICCVLATKKGVESKIIDNPIREARFSLPEVDSSNQQENKYPVKKSKNLLQENFYLNYSSEEIMELSSKRTGTNTLIFILIL